MKKRIRDEFLEFYRDRWTLLINTPTISVPTVLLILSNVQGKPYLLPLIIYIIIIYGIFSNSVYMWLAWIKTSPIGVSGKELKDTFAPKYPALRPFGMAGFLVSLLLIPIFGFVTPFKSPVQIYFKGTPTLTPTQTYTLTPSATITLTPTPKPLSDSLYYMIVYDSSLKMNESFHGQEKWQVARNLLVDIINGLNQRAKYSLVAIGGSNPVNTVDPCDSPTDLTLPFTSRQSAYDFLGGLQPQSGGSFYKAYTLAKNQLENLPEDTIRTLIYITGTSDSCETHDEWEALKNLIAVPDSTFGLFSQIIILDDDGIRAQTLADQLNNLSNENINVTAPQSVSEIQGNGVTTIQIINNVTNYVNIEIAARATDMPIPTVPVNTPFTSSNATLSPPTVTTFVSPVPTFTQIIPPTKTLTLPPPPTITMSPTFSILTPGNGTAYNCNSSSLCIQTVTIQWVPEAQTGNLHLSIWVKPFPGNPNFQYYVQPDPYYIGSGQWTSSEIYIGQPNIDPPGTPFRIYALVTSEVYSRGQSLDNLPANIVLSASVDVTR